MSNCTFFNNTFEAINRGATMIGTDRNLKSGVLVTFIGAIATAQFTNCNFINNKFSTGDLDKIHPMISIKPATTPNVVAPDITLVFNPAITFSNVISVGNSRASSMDGDLLYNTLINAPTCSNSVFNSVKKFDVNVVPTLDADVTDITGMTVNATAAVNSYFEMDGIAPKIVTNSLGVKSVVRKASGLNELSISDLKAWSNAGVLNVSMEQPQNVSIYNAAGVLVAKFKNTNTIQTNLSKGFYLVKNNANSLKVIVN
jgi:hypothetical protein